MWSTLAYPLFFFVVVRGLLYVFIVLLYVRLIEVIASNGSDEKIKIYELRLIKFVLSRCFPVAKQISIKLLLHTNFLFHQTLDSPLCAEIKFDCCYRASKRAQTIKIETWLIFLMFSLAIIMGNWRANNNKKNVWNLHEINFNLKSVMLPE